MVIAQHAVPVQDVGQNYLAVQGELESHADIGVRERRQVAPHREGVVLGAGRVLDRDVSVPREESGRPGLDVACDVDRVGEQSVGPRGGIGDGQDLGAVDVGPAGDEVVRVARQAWRTARVRTTG